MYKLNREINKVFLRINKVFLRIKFLSLIWIGKIIFLISKTFNLGAGGTWPGEIALRIKPDILTDLAHFKIAKGIILVAGTNGKTTTSLLIKTVLEKNGQRAIHNASGANLLNGLVSIFLTSKSADFAVLEVDENSLPMVLKFIKPQIMILLNLFRDQLDRYGEVEIIGDKWVSGFRELRNFEQTTVIINADDPQLAYLGQNLDCQIKYFGLEDKKLFLSKIQHATDSLYCPNCQNKLNYEGTFFSHLGIWECVQCGLKRPEPDLSSWPNLSNLQGVYNQYNLLAAVLTLKILDVKEKTIKDGLKSFKPAFGRGEEFVIDNKRIKIFLSKNPAGFNESLRTLAEFPGINKKILLILNDRIPDGRDVSWIWDVDFEILTDERMINRHDQHLIIISGDRAYDMGLRIKYATEVQSSKFKVQSCSEKFKIFVNLNEAIKDGLAGINTGETLYILATYSGMLEARKIIGGKKLL